MALATLSIDLVARLAQLEKDMGGAAATVKLNTDKMVAGFSAVRSAVAMIAGGAAVAAFTSLVSRSMEVASSFKDLSDATGASIENVSALDGIARDAGHSFESASGILVKFNSVLKDAKPGSSAERAIQALGLSVRELRQQDPVEALRSVAIALQGFADDGNKARLVQSLFGKSVQEAAPLLNDLAEANGLVARMTTAQADAQDRLNKQLAAMRSESEDLSRSITMTLVPAFAKMLKDLNAFREFGSLDLLWKDVPRFFANGSYLAGDPGEGINRLIRQRDELRAQQESAQALVDRIRSREYASPADRAIASNNEATVKSLEGQIDTVNRYLGVLRAKQRNALDLDAEYSDAVSRRQQQGAGKAQLGDIDGPDEKAAAEARARAKAQLESDLSQVRQRLEGLTGAYRSAERLMEAEQTKGVQRDESYYESKRAFVRLNAEAQEAALQGEIDRLRRENVTGTERIEMGKRIAEADAKILRVRADAAVELQLVDRAQRVELDEIARAYQEAQLAATAYVQSLDEQYSRQLLLLGASDREREAEEQRNQILERYRQQRDALDRDLRTGQISRARYDAELQLQEEGQERALASHAAFLQRRAEMEGDWVIGARRSLANYVDGVANVSAEMENVFTNGLSGMEDALTSFVTTGKLDFKSLADSIIADLARIAVRQMITGPIASMLGFAFADGGVMTSSGPVPLRKYANGGVATGPQLALFGEGAHNEAYVPLPDGRRIPVALSGGGQSVTQVISMTVGDVASMRAVRAELRAMQRQSMGAMGRSMNYGGDLS